MEAVEECMFFETRNVIVIVEVSKNVSHRGIYNDREMLTFAVEIAKLAEKIASTGFATTCAPFEFCKGAFQSI